MPLTAIHHVQLAMPPGGEDEATAFYDGVLGLARVPKPARLAVRGGCWFEAGPVRIHLGVEYGFRAARKAHPALVVDDLVALLEACRAAGFEPRPGDGIDGFEQAYVDDPFGNRLELLEAC
ncbi:MAG: glyoxalase [Acidimicrobiales bacterium]|nr:glyoxalase [Acidimicrobiales bacterium]